MDSKQPLTARQAQVYNFLVDFFDKNDQLPSTRAMKDHFGWGSQTSAMQMIQIFHRKNWLERNDLNHYRFVRPIARPAVGRAPGRFNAGQP